ncbi:MAG: GNAT family N-acetyltransferase [Faecousia sp.]
MMIETTRLILREMNMDDYDALYAVLADSDIMQHYPYTFDEKRVRGWIERNMQRYRIFGFGLWAVCLKESGEMIGDCGLTMQNIGGMIKPEIGYHIRGDCQRKGYAKEAASAVRDWAFTKTPFLEIYSYMKYTNEPSAKSAMSWGCHLVDKFEDEVNEITKVFMITKEEWKALKQKMHFGHSRTSTPQKKKHELHLQINLD